jgi:hypothetical protein
MFPCPVEHELFGILPTWMDRRTTRLVRTYLAIPLIPLYESPAIDWKLSLNAAARKVCRE